MQKEYPKITACGKNMQKEYPKKYSNPRGERERATSRVSSEGYSYIFFSFGYCLTFLVWLTRHLIVRRFALLCSKIE